MGELEDGPGGLGKTEESEARVLVAGNFEALDQGSDAGAIHVFYAGHIYEEVRDAELFEVVEDGFADFGRIEKSDIADEVKDSDDAELAS